MSRIVFIVALSIASVLAATQFNPQTDCTTYCGAVVNSTNPCGANPFLTLGFLDYGACMSFCVAMGSAVNATLGINYAGNINDTAGNTMGCRLYHIQFAITTNTSVHCTHASINGGGVCGTTLADQCGTYCIAQGAMCPEAFGGTYNGAGLPPTNFNAAYCAASCNAVAASFATFDNTTVSTSDNSLSCRIYHSYAAYNRSVNAFHCAHSTYLGGGVCIGTSQRTTEDTAFCAEVMYNCQGANAPYSSMSQCLSDSLTYNDSTIGLLYGPNFTTNAVGDTLACRYYHGSFPSAAAPGTHCPHAGYASSQCFNGTPRPSTPAPTSEPTTGTGTGTTAATGTTKPNSGVSLIASILLVAISVMIALF